MPKQQLSISRFEGGLVEVVDDRDLPENAISDIENLRVDNPGQLLLMPPSLEHASYRTANFAESGSSVTDHYGTYSFAADRKIGVTAVATTFATAESGAATLVTMSAAHTFCKGDMVRIVGTHDSSSDGGDYDGFFLIKNVGTSTITIN